MYIYRVLTKGDHLKEAEGRLNALRTKRYRLEQLERNLGTSPSSPTSKSQTSSQQNIEQIQPYLNKIFDEQQEIKARLHKLEAHLGIQFETSISNEEIDIADTLRLEISSLLKLPQFLKLYIRISDATITKYQSLV